MSAWQEVPRPPEPGPASRRAVLGRLAVPFVLAALLAVLGRTVLAGLVAVAATVIGGLTLWRPSIGERLARGFAAFGKAVANVVSWVLLAIVALLVIVPVWLLSRFFRRDLLATRAGAPTQWAARPERASSRHTFGRETPHAAVRGPVSRGLGRVPALIGAVVAILALNYALGWIWDEYAGSHDVPAIAGADSTVASLAASPVFADDAWSADYWREFDALTYDALPFLLTRVADVDGPMISSEDGVRRSYTPAGASTEVWFFGGGALWGEGQRDEHTIPSEVARLAEEEGVDLRVRNFGQPGYTTWQSAMLFEQELAVRPAPALAVFYDGADDVAVQVEDRTDGPSHYNAAGVETALTGRDSAAEQARDLWEEYRETSVLTRLAEGLGGVLGAQPAGADEPSLADHVLDLRARSRAMIEDVARDHGVPAVIAWQAAEGVSGDGGAYRAAAAADPTDATHLDLSAALDDVDDVYASGMLTDEAGARRAATALWAALRDQVG